MPVEQNFFIPESYLLDQKREWSSEENNYRIFKTNIDYTLDTKNTISLEAIGSIEVGITFEDLINLLRKQNNAFNSNTDRYSAEIERTKAVELSMDYRRKFVDIKNLWLPIWFLVWFWQAEYRYHFSGVWMRQAGSWQSFIRTDS